MILPLLLALQAPKLDAETILPVTQGVVSVEAELRLPKVGPQERAELEVLAAAMLDDTEDYGHRELVTLTVGSGETVRCDLLPDCLRIRFGVLDADIASAVPILANIVHSAELHSEALQAAAVDLEFRRRDYWSSALDPEKLNFQSIRLEDLKTLYRVVGKPENLVVTFAAPPEKASGLLEQWKAAVQSWGEVDASPFLPDPTPPKAIQERRGKLTTIVLRGRPLDPKSNFATDLLAIFALGGGKHSAVWETLREGLGWSYRQESLLRNCATGIEPDIEAVTESSSNDAARAAQVRPALEKAVAGWTEADRTHALASADALLSRDLGLDPIYFKSTRTSSQDDLFMQTYWRMKTGESWSPVRLLKAMSNVDLASMRAAAAKILESANVELIRGSG